MYILKNWYFEKEKSSYRVWGNAYGNDRFPEGQWIHTSAVTAISCERGSLTISTENSSYTARFCEHQANDQRVLRQALRDFTAPEVAAIYEKIGNAVRRKVYHEKKLPDPSTADTCAVLSFSSDIMNGFVALDLTRRKKHDHTVAYDVRKGMFQDLIEISDYELDYDFRFFAYSKNAFQFEPWSTKYSPVFLKNTGHEPIYVSTVYGEFEIPAGETKLLGTEDNSVKVLSAGNEDKNFDRTMVIHHDSYDK